MHSDQQLFPPVVSSERSVADDVDAERSSWLGSLWATAAVALFAIGLIWTSIAWNKSAAEKFARLSTPASRAAARDSFTPIPVGSSGLATIPIEQIRVGMRVPANNPQLSDADRAGGRV